MANVKLIRLNDQPPPVRKVIVTTRITETGTSGDVVGPSSAVAGNFPAFADTTGKLLEDSGFGPDSFVEPGDLAAVATTGSYNDLTDVPSTFAPSTHASSHVTGGTDKIRDADWTQDGLMTAAFAFKLDGIETGADVTDAANVGQAISGSDELTTPDDADKIPILDNSLSDLLKWFSWANLKATLKTYFDTLYPSGSGSSSGTNTGDQNLFGTIAVAGQSNVVADSTNDTLTLAAGSNITITTNPTTDTVTIAATGGGGGSGDVTGPGSSTDNALARYDGTTGKTIQNSAVTVADDGSIVSVSDSNAIHRFRGEVLMGVDGTGMNQQAAFGPSYGAFVQAGLSYLLGTRKITGGTGSPEGSITADPGSIYLNFSGGTNTTLYHKESGTGNTGWVAVVNSSGDVVGPASSTDNALARYDGTSGKLIQNSTVALSDAGDFSAVNSMDFTPITAPAHNEGLLYYDTDRKTLTAYIDEPDVSLQIGFEMWVRVRNSTGSTITNGQVVYISGATGQRPNITLAQANTLPTSRVIGVATHDIENNTDGIVTVFGTVRDLDTSAFTDGQVVYLSATTPGALTATMPSAPNLVVQVGVVQHAHITQGKLLIHPELDSVDADNIYNSTAAARAFIKNIDSSTGLTVQTGSTTFAKRTLTGTSNEVTVTNGDGASGNPTVSLPAVIDLGGKTSLEIPNSAAPSLSAIGQVALDTTVTDFTGGVMKYYDSSSAESGVVAMPITEFTSPTNGAVPTYDSTTDRFKMAVPSGGGGGGGSLAYVEANKGGTNQTGLGNNSWVTVTWPVEASDTGGDFASNTLTVAASEEWTMNVIVKTLEAHNGNLVQFAVYKDGSLWKLLQSGASYASGASYGGSVFINAAGDYDIRGWSPSGQALGADGTATSTYLQAIRTK